MELPSDAKNGVNNIHVDGTAISRKEWRQQYILSTTVNGDGTAVRREDYGNSNRMDTKWSHFQIGCEQQASEQLEQHVRQILEQDQCNERALDPRNNACPERHDEFR